MKSPNIVIQICFLDNVKKLSAISAFSHKKINQRLFYSCNNKKYNYVNYIQSGSKKSIDYVSYSGNREKSHGIFDADGLLSKKQCSALKSKLRKTESVIWHGFISFSEEFGQNYCNNYETAQKMMKLEFPRFLTAAGLNPDNVIWYAGLHENTDNLHIHFSFFEKQPTKYRAHRSGLHFSNGKLPYISIEKFKLSAEQNLTNSAAELKIARKQLNEATKNVLFSEQGIIKNNQKVRTLLSKLFEHLPSRGRFSYDSENMANYRPEIKEIINCLLVSDRKLYSSYKNFCRTVSDKDKDTLRILSNLKISKKHWNEFLISDKYLDDMYRRIGNQLLNSVRVYKGKLSKAKSKNAGKRLAKDSRFNFLTYCANLNAVVKNETFEAFEEYYRKIQEMQITKEVEDEID